MALLLLASPAELAAMETIAHARAWAGVEESAWNAVEEQLGRIPTLRVLASLPSDRIAQAVQLARVISIRADPDNQIDEERRDPTAVEITQVGLMIRVARQKFAMPDLDALQPTAVVAHVPPLPPAQQGGPFGIPPGMTIQWQPKDSRKIKMNQVVDQTDESEILPLSR